MFGVLDKILLLLYIKTFDKFFGSSSKGTYHLIASQKSFEFPILRTAVKVSLHCTYLFSITIYCLTLS